MPILLVGSPLELLTELIFSEYLDLFAFLVPNHSPLGIPWGFPIIAGSYISLNGHGALSTILFHLVFRLPLFNFTTKELFQRLKPKITRMVLLFQLLVHFISHGQEIRLSRIEKN